jgi:hypothetical protein
LRKFSSTHSDTGGVIFHFRETSTSSIKVGSSIIILYFSLEVFFHDMLSFYTPVVDGTYYGIAFGGRAGGI